MITMEHSQKCSPKRLLQLPVKFSEFPVTSESC